MGGRVTSCSVLLVTTRPVRASSYKKERGYVELYYVYTTAHLLL